MAKPIKETPVLKGKDAERFMEEMVKNQTRKATEDEKRKISESYRRISEVAQF